MPNQRFKLISAVHLFLIKENQVLLLRRFNTGYEDGNYSVVAGHIDGNESAKEAMAREAFEEAGVIINPNDLELSHLMHRKSTDERMDLFFTTNKWEKEPRIMEKDKCDDLSWFSKESLPENMIPYVNEALNNLNKDLFYSEFGWREDKLT